MAAIPIWKDTVFTASTDAEFSVSVGGKVIREGVASVFPDGTAKIYVNRIAETHLDTDLDGFTDGVHSHPNAVRTFSLVTDSGTTNYDFCNNWSYEEGKTTLSSPINGNADPRMKIFFTSYNESSRTICYD